MTDTMAPDTAPQPRSWRTTPSIHGRTWLEPEEFCYPRGGMTRRALALFPDGETRVVKAGIADTYFSIPASHSKWGSGYLSSNKDGELCFHPRKHYWPRKPGKGLRPKWNLRIDWIQGLCDLTDYRNDVRGFARISHTFTHACGFVAHYGTPTFSAEIECGEPL